MKPIKKGKSKKTVSGKKQNQAVAIALKTAGKSKKSPSLGNLN